VAWRAGSRRHFEKPIAVTDEPNMSHRRVGFIIQEPRVLKEGRLREPVPRGMPEDVRNLRCRSVSLRVLVGGGVGKDCVSEKRYF